AVIICRIAEGERQQTLLLQVTFMNTGKAAYDDRYTTQQTWRQRGVFAAAAFTIIGITDDHPLESMGFIVPGNLRNGLPRLTRDHIFALTGLASIGIDCAHKHIVAELVQMTTEAQPGTRWRNVVGGSLALGLD